MTPQQKLFNHMADEHGLTLTNEQLREIALIVKPEMEFPNAIHLLRSKISADTSVLIDGCAPYTANIIERTNAEYQAAIDLLKGI